ncbi:MAG: hypothetical protein A2X86_02825 [Bdellovibrionales bacterium GWA2_49_15]|nr:MAG: hypothetical protein A2X86_02825 [Bdellovibrionales bacterium GWA2_49_15]HAZ14127.1 hypothetical protein [Bdellovibrionales bacterium]
MMKTILIFLFLGVFSSFADENTFVLDSSVSKRALRLKITTVAMFETSCELTSARLSITGAQGFRPGVIDIVVGVTKKCVDLQGPHWMILDLPRGKELPLLPSGFYQIYIDGKSYQTIDVLPDRGSETGNG